MTIEGSTGNRRYVGNLHRSEQAAGFEVKMPAPGKVVVVSKFGNDIRTQVRGSRVVGGVKLRSQRGIERRGKYHFRALSCKLLRVLDPHCPYHLVVEVISHTELRGAGKVVPHLVIRILVEGGKNICGIGRHTLAVGRKQAPDLPAHKLPLATLQVQPEEAQAIGVTV